MSFLNWIAEWAEGIPWVGDHIAKLVNYIQSEIEAAYDWAKTVALWLYDSWRPYIENWIAWLYNTLQYAIDEINQVLKPTLAYLENVTSTLKHWYENVSSEINKLVSNPFDYIEEHIPLWIKNGVSNALSNIADLWNELTNLTSDFWNWIDNAPNWFLHQLQNAKDTIWSLVEPHVKPYFEWIENVKVILDEFVENPAAFIEERLPIWIKELPGKLNTFMAETNRQFNNVISAISNIDNFIVGRLASFVEGSIAWFLGWVLRELFTIEWDIERREPVEEPKNPIVKYLLQEVKIEKPKLEYESVKQEVEAE